MRRAIKHLAIAASLLAATPVLADYKLATSFTRIPTSQISHHAGITDCSDLRSSYDRTSLPHGDSARVLRAIDTRVKQIMSYRLDTKGAESWDSFAREVLDRASNVHGDCDDFTLTTMALAICAGIPAERLEFAITQTKPGPLSFANMSHAYLIYTDPQGERYIAGDTFGRFRRATVHDRFIMKASAREISKGSRMTWTAPAPAEALLN